MFHVDVTLEDCRIIAVESDVPNVLAATFADNVTVGLAGYDSPEILGFTYDSVAAEFADFPNECRPIP